MICSCGSFFSSASQTTTAASMALWAADDLLGASGASEDLARLADAGLGGRPVVFDGDRTDNLVPGSRAVTDGFRARDRWFGAPRGQDVSSGLDVRAAERSSDYLPWPEVDRRSLVTWTGIREVRASTSIADDFSAVGLQPAHRPFAAVDGNPRTAWATAFDASPELTIALEEPTDVRRISVRPYADRVRFGQGLGVATALTVTTDRGSVDVRLPASGALTDVPLPSGSTSRVSVRIRDTSHGRPSEVVTGLSEVSIQGVRPVEVVRAPLAGVPSADTAVLGAGLPGRDGCSVQRQQFTCFSGLLVDPESTGPMVRDVVGLAPGERILSGALVVDPLNPPKDLLDVPGVEVTASSLRGYAPAGLPVSVVDSDPRTAWSPSPDDETPSVTITLDQQTAVDGIRVQTRRDWAKKEAPAVVVEVGGTEVTRRLPEHGLIRVPPTLARTITLTFVSVPGRGRPGLGALELEEVELVGHSFARPAVEKRGACGEGPRVTVEGRPVATRASGPREAVFGIGEFTWQACGPVSVSGAASQRITVAPWGDLVPRSLVVSPEVPHKPVGAEAISHERVSPSLIRAEVPTGAQRVVVMRDNANPGWRAALRGTPLQPQVVDGRRQAFVVPEGASGRLVIEFAPDRPYRWGLALGAVLALLVVAAALLPDRHRPGGPGRPRPPSGRPAPSPRSAFIIPVAWSGAVAGPAGLLVGALSIVVTRVRSSRMLPTAAVLALGSAAAVVQAWAAPGFPGSSAVEGAVRLLVLGAFAISLATPQEPPDEG